jgi:hypothetical protein
MSWQGPSGRQFLRRHCTTAVVAALMLPSVTAWTHHGVTGEYDTSTPIVISGTVTHGVFAPPHPVLSVRVDASELPEGLNVDRPDIITGPLTIRVDDAGEVRAIELPPLRAFHELGRKLRGGDHVTLIALRNCLPPHELRSSWIQLPDGHIVSQTGDKARRTHGCQ